MSCPQRSYRELRPEIDRAIADVLASGRWLDGPWTRRFGEELARWCGVDHCVPVANGTDALELALRGLGIGAGDEVVTVANAGGYATTACRLVGAVPVWVDVREDTLGVDPDEAVAAVGDRTRAIVVTHLYGLVCDVAALRAALVAGGRGDVYVVEDCAQAHGATLGGRRVGALGDVAAFSFYPTKNLGALGDAGALVTGDAQLAERLSRLRQYGWEVRYRSREPGGRNSRMDELQAAVLCVKLPHVERWNERRRAILARYVRDLRPPARPVAGGAGQGAAHLAVLRVPQRDEVRRRLAQAWIESAVHYPTLDCDQPSQQGLPARRLSLATSARAVGEVLSLPCFPELTAEEEDAVVDTVNRVLSDLG